MYDSAIINKLGIKGLEEDAPEHTAKDYYTEHMQEIIAKKFEDEPECEFYLYTTSLYG